MPHINFCYEFENYRVDIAQRVLTREGEVISLTPKATDVLLMLLQNAGQLVERDSLISEVWPDSFVEEGNLTQNIFLLRRTLQDHGTGQKFIETVTRRGYRFVAPVKKVPAKTDHYEVSELPRRQHQIPILAVLPFANVSGNIDLQYLAEGIPESIINSLSSLSQIRVISRSTTFRYKNREFDPQTVGQKLGADVLLMGKISLRDSVVVVAAELVSAENGWQLWGQTFDVDTENIFEIQDQITQHISSALNLPLTREDEKRVAKRYTENAAAYQAYLEGRYYWSRYARAGIEKAIGHFGRAIDLDANYALAYAGIVDCYLRLATNYLPPEDDLPVVDEGELEREPNRARALDHDPLVLQEETNQSPLAHEKVKLRHEWDWKGAERELRRANELKTDYPAAHQWHAAYKFAEEICAESSGCKPSARRGFKHFRWGKLPIAEEVQVLCSAAREQIEVGNYQGGCLALRKWWVIGDWPKLDGLTTYSAADLLFTTGTLADCMASTGQFVRGHKHSEALLNGALALCKLLGLQTRSSEVRAELGACYYRQGFFDLARATLETALVALVPPHQDLTSLCLFRLAVVDRHAGRLNDSLKRLMETAEIAKNAGPWILGRYHQELGTTLRDLGTAEGHDDYFKQALDSFRQALYEFEAVGNHRYVAAVHNNIGFVLLTLKQFAESEVHLFKSRKLFESFRDEVRCSQVDETLAQLYVVQDRFDLAEQMITRSIAVLEKADEEALLAEALITHGNVLLGLHRDSEAKAAFDGAHRIAERCGHYEGAGLALLLLLEHLSHRLLREERSMFLAKMQRLLAESQHASIKERIKKCEKKLLSCPFTQ